MLVRYNQLFDSINAKLSVFLAYAALNTSILSAAAAKWTVEISNSCGMTYLLVGSIISGFLALGILLWSAIPFLHSHGFSNYFFGTVAHRSLEKFKVDVLSTTKERDAEDLIEQIHSLAVGLTKKYNAIRYAGLLLVVQLILETILTLNIIL